MALNTSRRQEMSPERRDMEPDRPELTQSLSSNNIQVWLDLMVTYSFCEVWLAMHEKRLTGDAGWYLTTPAVHVSYVCGRPMR